MASSCSDLKSQELFYSFNFVLQTKGPGIIAVGLQGDDVQAPFVFTNWQGAAHNRVLDLDHIKGVAFELTMDPQGVIGSTATGSLSFGPSSVSNKEAQNNVTQECQEGEIISVKYIPNHFRTIHHEQNCCERCLADDECFFAFSTGVLYYLAPYVGPGIVGVKNDILSDFRVFAVSSPDKFLRNMRLHPWPRPCHSAFDTWRRWRGLGPASARSARQSKTCLYWSPHAVASW